MQYLAMLVAVALAVAIVALAVQLHRRTEENWNLRELISGLQKSTETLEALAFGDASDAKAIDTLIRALDDRDPRIRSCAGGILARLGSSIVPPLSRAIAQRRVSTTTACDVLLRAVHSTVDVRAALDLTNFDSVLCADVLIHPLADLEVLRAIVENGPPDVLPKLVVLPSVQDTAVLGAAQRRLKAEAARREELESSSSGSQDADWQYETGNCDCRYR